MMSDFLFTDDPMDIDEDLLDDESMDSFFSADIGERRDVNPPDFFVGFSCLYYLDIFFLILL